jgi:hypothetical protein
MVVSGDEDDHPNPRQTRGMVTEHGRHIPKVVAAYTRHNN